MNLAHGGGTDPPEGVQDIEFGGCGKDLVFFWSHLG